MEPIEAKVRYVVNTHVVSVNDIKGAFYYHFDGSRESIYLGPVQYFKPGDKVRITFERIEDGKEV